MGVISSKLIAHDVSEQRTQSSVLRPLCLEVLVEVEVAHPEMEALGELTHQLRAVLDQIVLVPASHLEHH